MSFITTILLLLAESRPIWRCSHGDLAPQIIGSQVTRRSCGNPQGTWRERTGKSERKHGIDNKANWANYDRQDNYKPNVDHIKELVQENRNPIANALELRLSCTNPSIWHLQIILIGYIVSVTLVLILSGILWSIIAESAFLQELIWYDICVACSEYCGIVVTVESAWLLLMARCIFIALNICKNMF